MKRRPVNNLKQILLWERNRRPAMTPKEKVLSKLRPVAGETLTVTEIPTAGEILKRVLKPSDPRAEHGR